MEISTVEIQKLNDLISNIHKDIRVESLIGLCGGRSVSHITDSIFAHISNHSSSKFNTATYFTIDERLVDLESADSNFKLLNESFFQKLHSASILPFSYEQEEESLRQYTSLLNTYQNIDLCVLSVGEDGHIAGLFPNLAWNDDSAFFTFNNSPKPPAQRMSASPKTIQLSKHIILLFIGEAKKEAFQRFMRAEESIQSLPCLIAKSCSNLHIVTDIKI